MQSDKSRGNYLAFLGYGINSTAWDGKNTFDILHKIHIKPKKMPKSISTLTYKIVASSEIKEIDMNESIDWAIEMIEIGYESPSLLILSSFEKPSNHFETIHYAKKALDELGFMIKTGDAAALSYASYYIHKIANRDNTRENLTQLYIFYQSTDYDTDLLYNFYLLYWAWDDLDYEDNHFNHYWDGATQANIEQITVDEAKKWIEEHQKHYKLIRS